MFVALPIAYWVDLLPVNKIVPLILLFGYCLFILIKRKKLGKSSFSIKANWNTILFRFVLITIVMGVVTTTVLHYPLFADLGENQKLLFMILLYPALSAFPQELIFREFFFYRYEKLVPNQLGLLLINMIVFSFAHIYFASWVVIVFTLLGGLLFAVTYLKTRSVLVVTIEHSLYGLCILCSGLNVDFYKAF